MLAQAWNLEERMVNYEFVGTLATIITASVAVVGLILRMDGRISGLEQRITAQGEKMNERIDALGKDVNGRIDVLNGRVSRIEGLIEGYFMKDNPDDSPHLRE